MRKVANMLERVSNYLLIVGMVVFLLSPFALYTLIAWLAVR